MSCGCCCECEECKDGRDCVVSARPREIEPEGGKVVTCFGLLWLGGGTGTGIPG